MPPPSTTCARWPRRGVRTSTTCRRSSLDRPRNQHYIDAIREAGARIRLIRDGDVSAAISTAREESNVDILLGIGRLTGGGAGGGGAGLPRRRDPVPALAPRRAGAAWAIDNGLDLDQVMSTRELVDSNNVFFAATGVTTGEFLDGVEFFGDGAVTHSVVMRSKTGSVREMTARHDFRKLRAIKRGGAGLIGALRST